MVLGYNPYEALFQKQGLDPIGKKVRIGAIEFTVVGVLKKRPLGRSATRTTSSSSRRRLTR